jgi:hypothetical protein
MSILGRCWGGHRWLPSESDVGDESSATTGDQLLGLPLRAARVGAGAVFRECHDEVEIAQLLQTGADGAVTADGSFERVEALANLALL